MLELFSNAVVAVFRLLSIILILIASVQTTFATPYWPPERVAEEYARSGAEFEPRFVVPTERDRASLDEIAYFAHYRMLCDFLVSLQYLETGANRGGMREGESGGDYTIIETDNTQEAIRVWSQYAVWTGDTATYGWNIRLAQGYCQRFPAWREGGGYYAIHNCGWGFEAERIYRQAYGDTSWTWYADSCALWVIAHPLDYDPNSTGLGQLNPCAQGLGIGGMYPHTLYRNREDWRQFTLNEARRLRTWFESNPQRLHQNEVWALCGGTALWGICESLFRAYPDSGQTWLAEYGPLLDVWQPTGSWNHAFNTWYCNAQHVCYQITQDSLYWNNAVFITDSLIGLDTDRDGGIPPGRTYPVTNDHSWVSAYMGWMGMERIIDSMPVVDAMAVGFVSPDSSLLYPAGDTLRVAAKVVNASQMPLTIRVRVSGQAFLDSADVSLEAGGDSTLAFVRPWILPDDDTLPLLSPLQLAVSAAGDENPNNDTITAFFDVRRGVNVEGAITAEGTSTPFPVRVEFVHEGYPDSLWTFVEQSTESLYTNGARKLMAGVNTVRVIAPTPLMIAEQTVELTPGDVPQRIDFVIPFADVVLVDDDHGDEFESYYRSSLDSFPLAVRWWDCAAWGAPDLTDVPTVIWFTGNDSTTSLEASEQFALRSHLENGGKLILSGQDIADDLGADSPFMSEILHCALRSDNTGLRHIYGMDNDPITDGLGLYLIGSQGAQNQTSPASVNVLAGGQAILNYSGQPDEICGVAGAYESGQVVFLSFGLEAVSGISNSTTRRAFFERCFRWFGDSLTTDAPDAAIPLTFTLEQNYPNPFNPVTLISFAAPRGVFPVSLTVYNILGQRVRTLYRGSGNGMRMSVIFDGADDAGSPLASGVYVYELRAGQSSTARRLHLMR
ncbi:MAG: T9SS type A sorting domain-containing protein [bacterium]|nr:T9SS type A sorting domain-containing protein [bacterium]